MAFPDAIPAAAAVATRLGIPFAEAELVADDPNGIVRLLPGPLLARVTRPGTLGRGPEALVLALAAAGHCAARGAPVSAPATEVDAGPHEQDGCYVTLWRWVPDHGRRDPAAAGGALLRVHEALADFGAERLPAYHLEEIRALVAAARPSATVAAGDLSLLAAETERLAALVEPLPLQGLHGDAHLGNVLWSPVGPVWGDWEMACSGPRELDLAALLLRTRTGRPTAGVEEALAAYGPHDEELREALVPLAALMTTAWMLRVAEVSPTRVPPAALRARLDWWRGRVSAS